MMRLKAKDLVATVLVAAIAVPYIGYLARGEMPFIKDPRGMAATGLVLGVAALAFAEAASAEVLLALFMVSIALVWAMKLIDHAGVLHWHGPTGVAR